MRQAIRCMLVDDLEYLKLLSFFIIPDWLNVATGDVGRVVKKTGPANLVGVYAI